MKKRWIAALAVLAVALGLGLSSSALEESIPAEPTLLNLFPQDTAGILFVDVQELQGIPLFEELIREQAGVQTPFLLEDFSQATGFDLRTDVEHLALGSTDGRGILAAARASYDPASVTAYFLDRGLPQEPYGEDVLYGPGLEEEWRLSFADGWILLGQDQLLRDTLDRMRNPAGTAMDNPTLVRGIESIEDGAQLWAAGAFDQGLIPDGIAPPMAADLIASLERGTYQMRFGEAVTGRAVGQFTTLEAAGRTSTLLQGLLTLGRIQAAEQPEVLELLNGIQVETLDQDVLISFSIDSALLQGINESGLRIR